MRSAADSTPSAITVYSGAGVFIKNITLPNTLGVTDVKIADIDLDGVTEVVVAVSAGFACTPRAVYVYNYNTGIEEWHYNEASQSMSLAIGNIDGDPQMEVLTGGASPHNGCSANGMTDSNSWIVVLEHDGTLKWNKLIGTSSALPFIADINNDGANDVIVTRSQYSAYPGTDQVLILQNATGNILFSYDTGTNDAGQFWPIIADVTGTAEKEIIGARQDGYILMLDTSLSLIDQYNTGFALNTFSFANDLDNDGKSEIVVIQNTSTKVSVLNSTLDEMWSYTLPSPMSSYWYYGIADNLIPGGTNELIMPTNASLVVLTADVAPPTVTPPARGAPGQKSYYHPEANFGVGVLKPNVRGGEQPPPWNCGLLVPLLAAPHERRVGFLVGGFLERPGISWPMPLEIPVLAVGQGEAGLIVLETRRDGWIRLRYAFPYSQVGDGTAWTHASWLALGPVHLELIPWQEFFPRRDTPPLVFRDGARHALFAAPESSSTRLASIEGDYGLRPLEFLGDWMRVSLVRPMDWCATSVTPTRIEGWIPWRSASQGPMVWVEAWDC